MGSVGIEWIVANAPQLGATTLLAIGIWALITGKLITVGRLEDHQRLIELLREENAQHRATAEVTAKALTEIVRQMSDINRVLEALSVDPPPRKRVP